jgi:tetratricopeptide (TPR) repeat protein
MAIADPFDASPTITEGWRTVELFTNRYTPVRQFLYYLNEDTQPKPILFFSGDGGNGKSLLLRVLREQYCVHIRPTNWEWIKERSPRDITLVEETKRALDKEPVLAASIDFRATKGDERPQEAFSGLLILRRALSNAGLHFPLFDFSCLWYLDQTHRLNSDYLASLFPPQEMDFITMLASAISQKTWFVPVNVVLKLFGKHLREQFTLYAKQRKLEAETVNDIQRMEPHSELIQELPRLFAEDLNASLSLSLRHKRVVLFFDSHEAFWGYERNVPTAAYYERDEWLRKLLTSLDFSSGIRVVMAGREPPRWADATKFAISKRFVDHKPLQELSTSDGKLYLTRAGISNPKMRDCIVQYARVRRNRSHPFLLGLCADVVLIAAANGEDLAPSEFRTAPQTSQRAVALIRKLLSYANPEVAAAVRALSACRAFDREIYLHLASVLKFHASGPSFDVLTQFSFVWRSGRHERGGYRIHDLLRRLLYERNDELTRQADQSLQAYFRQLVEQGDELAIADAIYHSNRSDWKAGAEEWLEVFDHALEASRHDLCRALLEISVEMIIKHNSERGQIAECAGHYFMTVARYEAAEQKYLEALALYDKALRGKHDPTTHDHKGLALSRLGDLYAEVSRHKEALKTYHKAMACLDRAISELPGEPDPLNNKGSLLSSLGDLQVKLSQFTLGRASYEKAMECFERALKNKPKYVEAYTNKAFALISQGDMESELSEYEHAAESFGQAIAVCEAALQLFPMDLVALNNKATALLALGEVQTVLTNFDESRRTYDRAIVVYDEILALAPGDVVALTNIGASLISIGELNSTFSLHEKAVLYCEKGIETIDEALRFAPGEMSAVYHKGRGLGLTAQIRFEQARYAEAATIYEKALGFYDEGLTRAPQDVTLRGHRAALLADIGDLQFELAHYEEAVSYYQRAAISLEEALTDRPDDLAVLGQQAILLRQLGEGYTQLSNHERAAECFWRAITVNELVLDRAPNDVATLDNQAEVFKGLGGLQLVLAQHQEALHSLEQSVAAFDRILISTPEQFSAYVGKAEALESLSEIQTDRSDYSGALRGLELALATFHEASQIAPNDIRAQLGTASILSELGELRRIRSEYPEAMSSLTSALTEYERLSSLTPGYVSAHAGRANTLLRIANLQADMAQYGAAVETYRKTIAASEGALLLAENSDEALDIKVCALFGLAFVQRELSLLLPAEANFEQANSILEELMKRSPTDLSLMFNMAESICDLAQFLVGESRYEEANGRYRRALELCDQALALAPTDIALLILKASAARGLGDLQAELSQYDQATVSYEMSLANCSEVLVHAPNNPRALQNKGEAIVKLANAAFETGEEIYDLSFNWAETVALCDQALTIAPNDVEVKTGKARTLLALSRVKARLSNDSEAFEDLEAGLRLLSECHDLSSQSSEVKNLRDQFELALKILSRS